MPGFRSCLVAATLALLPLPAAAGDLAAAATYAVALGGTNIANVDITFNATGERYSMDLTARITGMATFVAGGTAKVDSAGISNGSGLESERFDLLTRSQGEEFAVAVEYANADVTAFKVVPPIVNEIDRVALERKHLRGVNDMMAAFVLKGGGLDAGLCSRKMQIFTGVERFNLDLSFARADVATSKRTGYQGPLVLCTVHYTPVSGHYTTSEITTYLAQSDRILVWYAPLAAGGYFIPYRALLATSAGDLSVVLTELKQ